SYDIQAFGVDLDHPVGLGCRDVGAPSGGGEEKADRCGTGDKAVSEQAALGFGDDGEVELLADRLVLGLRVDGDDFARFGGGDQGALAAGGKGDSDGIAGTGNRGDDGQVVGVDHGEGVGFAVGHPYFARSGAEGDAFGSCSGGNVL